jgi:hypothetical protein
MSRAEVHFLLVSITNRAKLPRYTNELYRALLENDL